MRLIELTFNFTMLTQYYKGK